ncbi:unnamed protein product [Parascedosporium putredinis]|uniref:Uncharacterized protein n=1 Tax=Parascedosporium putredinis TaxID=1442378 RepID=A0A9P1M6X2_9PEZI|nr:unnamed protein product [Parascedosporium putredinis]CAI7990528.1 unnamed protein product [Parascedosporium putredinis]
MAPKRVPVKRKAVHSGDFDSDFLRSPRLEAGQEGSDSDLDSTGDAFEKMTHAALQPKSDLHQSKSSAKFLARFREQRAMEKVELAKYAQEKMAEMDDFTDTFIKETSAKYSNLLGLLGSSPDTPRRLESHPLYKQGQEVVGLFQDILKQYEDANKVIRVEAYPLPISPSDDDCTQVREIINMAARLGEMAIDGAFRVSSDDPQGLQGARIPLPELIRKGLPTPFEEKSRVARREAMGCGNLECF